MLQKAYGWKPGGLWGTDPLYMLDGSGTYFYHNDHLGTPQRLSSATTGAVVWSAGYQAFGLAVVDPLSTVENNLRFPGQYFDAETGLHYNWMRTYDPGTGRYTQVDPIGFAGGDVDLYRYVFNRPGSLADPSGLFGEFVIDEVISYITETVLEPVLDGMDPVGKRLILSAIGGAVGGAVLGGAIGVTVGAPGAPVTGLAGAIIGGVAGFTGGLTTQLALEIFGIGEPMEIYMDGAERNKPADETCKNIASCHAPEKKKEKKKRRPDDMPSHGIDRRPYFRNDLSCSK